MKVGVKEIGLYEAGSFFGLFGLSSKIIVSSCQESGFYLFSMNR